MNRIEEVSVVYNGKKTLPPAADRQLVRYSYDIFHVISGDMERYFSFADEEIL